MPAFPFSLATYPVTRALVCPSVVHTSNNGKEQRFRDAPGYYLISVTTEGLKATDAQTVLQFFIDAKGQFATDITIDIDGVTYSNCSFDQDEMFFRVDPASPELQSAELKLRQSIAGVLTGTDAAAFPTFEGGIRTQMPFDRGIEFSTLVSDVEHGRRFTRYQIAGGLRQWALNYPRFSVAEAEALEAFFIAKHGMVGSFSFTDPQTGDVYPNCRFDADTLEMCYVEYDIVSTAVKIREFVP